MLDTPARSRAEPGDRVKYGFIDALRGYAVLLVIMSHAAGACPELPWPVKRVAYFGWFGVQLFFLMSCVTLIMSWHASERRGDVSVGAFWARRLFRIAPMYYLAIPLYVVARPPAAGFDPILLVSTLSFINSWHPALLPIQLDRWTVVPGGWSISVEFCFYAVFPLIVTRVRSLYGALVFCAGSFVLACVANSLAQRSLGQSYDPAQVERFLNYWFPTQLPVFAMGTALFFVLRDFALRGPRRPGRGWTTPVLLGVAACCALSTFLPLPGLLTFQAPLPLQRIYIAAALFMVAVLALSMDADNLFNNRAIRSMGEVSFSAYLLHFAVLDLVAGRLPRGFDRAETGWKAILVFVVLWVIVVLVTYALSRVTFALIERPMIGVGRRVLSRRRARPAPG